MPITLDFTGKLVLITGGGRGIGWAITLSLAKDVAVTYTSSDSSKLTDELSQTAGVKVKSFKCEVTDSKQVDSCVEEVEKVFGKRVDIGIACAGIALWKDAHDNTDALSWEQRLTAVSSYCKLMTAEFQRIFEVNTFGCYYFARALTRSWIDVPISVSNTPTPAGNPRNLGKQILFVSSISALVAMKPQNQCAYNASKAAVTMLSKSLAGEWAPWGITVNSISPGYVSTDMIANPPDEEAKAWASTWQEATPAGRFATAEEIGDCVALMVSDKQGGMGWMTGSDLVIDGGYTIF